VALPAERRVSVRWGWAGEKSGLFEHPACGTLVVLYAWVIESHCAAIVVPQPANRLKPVENQV
jgi:hypothetical protein